VAVIKIEGLKELDRALAKMGDVATAEKHLVAALRYAGKPIREAAAAKAPVGDGPKGGLLRASVKSIKKPYRTGRKASAEIHIGARPTKKFPVFYAWFVEFGTKKHTVTLSNDKRRKGLGSLVDWATGARYGQSVEVKQRAKPFLEPAFDAHADKAPKRFYDNLYKRLAKVFDATVLKPKGGQ